MLVRGNGCSLHLQTLMPLIALTLQLFASIADRVNRETMFYTVENASLTGNVTMVKLVTDELDCAFLCLRNDNPAKCFSFNFGRAADKGLHTCELSDSERTLEPHNMQSKKGFDYYGMETEYLSRFFPCLSSPCVNGGSCVNGPELDMFFCKCPLEIKVLPYLDNRCNVNHSLIEIDSLGNNFDIFHTRVGRYKLNYFEAERLCQILGATLASLAQLTAAWQGGLQKCRYGWLNESRVAYPMQSVKERCGNKSGIVGGVTVQNKITKTSDAWCFKGSNFTDNT